MRKLRFYSGVVKLFIRRFIIHIAAGVVFGVLAFLFKDYIISLPLFTTQERIGVFGRYEVDSIPLSITQEISTGLTMLDEEGFAQAGMAQKWEALEDGKVWVFTLKKNLKWQDGSAVKTKDLKYNFPDVEIVFPDEKNIEFHAKDPYAAFPILVSRPLFKKGLLGVGDWQVKTITYDEQTINTLVLENQTTRKRKSFRFFDTEQKLILAYKLGEIDQILEISDPKDLTKWKNSLVYEIIEYDHYAGLFFNSEDPMFNDNKQLRQALAYAINKKKLSDFRALSPVSPNSWGFNSLVKPYEYDVRHAKELYSKLKKEQKPEKLSLVTIPALLPQAESIAQNWKEVFDITTTVQVAPGVPPGYQILLGVMEIPPDPDQYSLWHSTQKETNITHINSPRIDKLLEDGRRKLDIEERKRIYLDFQRFLVEEATAVFLYHPKSYSVVRR